MYQFKGIGTINISLTIYNYLKQLTHFGNMRNQNTMHSVDRLSYMLVGEVRLVAYHLCHHSTNHIDDQQ